MRFRPTRPQQLPGRLPRTVLIQIFLNRQPQGFNGYQPGHLLQLAYSYHDTIADLDTADHPADAVDRLILDRQYLRFNDLDGHAAAREYYEAGNRSITSGDLIGIDGRLYASIANGWTRLQSPTHLVLPHS